MFAARAQWRELYLAHENLGHAAGADLNLDQTITRARFNVDTLDQLDPSEKQLAIQRLMLPDTDAHHMPPVRFHTLSDAERQLVIDELSR